uniref:Uncharacterized protein n=1 Tax=Candidatus Kentrum sp. TC TaxID=2126339 RepID=A0A450Z6S4_9GAMM|nr:MAG: hypothetical protein BECKTC1821E_GA0114239_11962 [Candidatus Kentron sp. TC]
MESRSPFLNREISILTGDFYFAPRYTGRAIDVAPPSAGVKRLSIRSDGIGKITIRERSVNPE